MDTSENQHTARMKGGCLHETEPFKPNDGVERSIENYERIIGHAVLQGVIDAEEAYRLIGNYQVWYAVDPAATEL